MNKIAVLWQNNAIKAIYQFMPFLRASNIVVYYLNQFSRFQWTLKARYEVECVLWKRVAIREWISVKNKYYKFAINAKMLVHINLQIACIGSHTLDTCLTKEDSIYTSQCLHGVKQGCQNMPDFETTLIWTLVPILFLKSDT